MPAQIEHHEQHLTVTLPNGVEVALAVTNKDFQGIAAASLNGKQFLVPGRGSKPYFITPDGITYHHFHLRDARPSGEGAVLELEAVGVCAPLRQDRDMFLFPRLAPKSGEVRDTLEVRLEPRMQTLNGEDYYGFSVSYAFRSDSRAIHWMLESVAIAPGGALDGAVVMAQHMTSNICRLEEEVSRESVYSTEENYDASCIHAPSRGGGSPLFDIVHGSGLAVVSYFEEPGALKSVTTKEPGEDFVTVADFHYQTLSTEFTTQPRIVLATAPATETRARRLNRWTAWFDFTTAAWQKALGIRPTETLTTIAFDGTGGGGVDPGTTYPELLIDWAERMPWLRDHGIRGVILHTPEWLSAGTEPTVIFGGNNCCPQRFRLSDFLGGDAGLRRFCDAAHDHGVKVFVWICGHFHNESPIWKEHPEWGVRNEGQMFWDGQYQLVRSLDFAHGGREWMAADLKHVREATGVDGVWFDSWANLGIQPINFQSPGREPNAPGAMGLIGDLSQMGYEIMFESMSQLGVSSWGNLAPEALQGQEELLYNTNLRTYLDDWLANPTAYSADYYFRTLAARSPIGMWIREYQGKPAAFPLSLPDWLTPLNLAYAQVEARMQSREVLEDGLGVLWRDAQNAPSALFAFRDASFTFDMGATNLMTGEAVSPGPAPTVSGHIYAFALPQ